MKEPYPKEEFVDCIWDWMWDEGLEVDIDENNNATFYYTDNVTGERTGFAFEGNLDKDIYLSEAFYNEYEPFWVFGVCDGQFCYNIQDENNDYRINLIY